MENSFKGRYCGICNHELGRGYFSLSKCSQTVTGSQPGVVLVSDDSLLTDFCGHECADYAEAAITSTLTSAYPTADKMVPCSLCLRPVDRTAPHVSVSMSQLEDASEPWLVSARVVHERELAVYCHCCAEPGTDSRAFDEAGLGIGA